MSEYDISVGTGKTLDARKKQPPEIVNDDFEITMTSYKAPKANTGGLDPRKKVAKPAATSEFECTMI